MSTEPNDITYWRLAQERKKAAIRQELTTLLLIIDAAWIAAIAIYVSNHIS